MLESHIKNAVPLSSLSEDRIFAVSGRTSALPSAKSATQAYYFAGGNPPVPDGVKISQWTYYPETSSGWWVARRSAADAWGKPCVFRVREVGESSASAVEDRQDALIAVLERIANALEGLQSCSKIEANSDD